ncbi:MAG: LuxR C-terminal-related transcriptional regulator [Gammaproteobacteria bacterium]|nr:LuxR C-terminal-related transcriptional regulator [Gammaproteobacteria bacterium]
MVAAKELVIETKLVPPHTYKSITRERLRAPDALVQGQYKIALVTAPAGYGKSTLLGHWYQQLKDEGLACTWLSIESHEDDATRFIRYLAHSIEMQVQGFSHGIISLLDSGSDPESQSFAEHFLTMLNALDERIFIFFDDFHCIKNPRLLELFDWSVNHLAANVTFIIGSREILPFSTARLKVQHQLLLLEIKDLRFTEYESRELLKDEAIIGADNKLIQQLTERTEGWPAALVLASLSLETVEDIDEFVANIAGEEREITDYLATAVLAGLTEDLAEFMKKISLCDRFTPALCEAMTDRSDSRAYLEEIRRRNMFLVALDRRGKWFRFHHLFGGFLQARLRDEQQYDCASLYSRAASWHFSNGTIDEGVQYALLAEEYDLAAEWIAGYVEELVQQRGKHSTLLSWLEKLPEEVLQRWTEIRIFYAWSLNFMHQYDAAEQQLEKLEKLRTRLLGVDESGEKTADRIALATGMIRSIQWALRDGVEKSAHHSSQWLKNWNDHKSFAVAPVQVVHGFACKCKSDFKGCHSSITESYAILESAKSFYILAWAVLIMTLSLAKQGKHNEAIKECNRYKAKIDEELGSNSHSSKMLSALLAAMHYEQNELSKSRDLLQDCLAYVREQGSVDSVIAAYTTESRLRIQNHDVEGGFSILDEGQTLGRQRDFPRLAVTLLGEKILAHLRLKQVTQAQNLVTEYEDLSRGVEGTGYGSLPLADLLKARVLIARGDSSGEALDLLSTAIHRARNLGLGRRLIELLIVRSLVRAKIGQTNEALRDLRDALQRAAPQNYLRVFLDEGDAVRQLLIQLVSSGPGYRKDLDADYMDTLLEGFDLPAGDTLIQENTADRREPTLPEGVVLDDITAKEISILQLLSEGKSNKQIAETLFVTEGTVKWHLHNIYTKLNARNRSEAVALARKFTIIY